MRNERDFKGIWIPKEVWFSNELTHTEKFLLLEIDSLDNEEGCYASNEHFAKFLNRDKVYVSQMISKLVQMDFVFIQWKGNPGTSKRILRSNLKKLYGQRVIIEKEKEIEEPALERQERLSEYLVKLRDIPGFLDIWIKYKNRRRDEMKVPISKKQEEGYLRDLCSWHETGYNVVDIITQSYNAWWKSLWPKGKPNSKTNEKTTAEKYSQEGFGHLKSS